MPTARPAEYMVCLNNIHRPLSRRPGAFSCLGVWLEVWRGKAVGCLWAKFRCNVDAVINKSHIGFEGAL